MARKTKTLSKGDTVTIKDRLWGIVDVETGRLVMMGQVAAIYSTRAAAMDVVNGSTCARVIRLSDIAGTVV